LPFRSTSRITYLSYGQASSQSSKPRATTRLFLHAGGERWQTLAAQGFTDGDSQRALNPIAAPSRDCHNGSRAGPFPQAETCTPLSRHHARNRNPVEFAASKPPAWPSKRLVGPQKPCPPEASACTRTE
jgi:hypothetical protein